MATEADDILSTYWPFREALVAERGELDAAKFLEFQDKVLRARFKLKSEGIRFEVRNEDDIQPIGPIFIGICAKQNLIPEGNDWEYSRGE